MPRRVTAFIALAFSVAACSAPASPGVPASAPASPGAPTAALLEIRDAAYLAGEPFSLPTNGASVDWTAPAPVPITPDGRTAVRVAFLPADCSRVGYAIEVANDTVPAPQGAQTFSCPATADPDAYLYVGYRPFEAGRVFTLGIGVGDVLDPPAHAGTVPVYTSADAMYPSVAAGISFGLDPLAGPEQPRDPKESLFKYALAPVVPPDGVAPNQWGFRLTDCDSRATNEVTVTLSVNGGAPIPVAICGAGSNNSSGMSFPVPAAGSTIRVLLSGATSKSSLRLTEYFWRGYLS